MNQQKLVTEMTDTELAEAGFHLRNNHDVVTAQLQAIYKELEARQKAKQKDVQSPPVDVVDSHGQ